MNNEKKGLKGQQATAGNQERYDAYVKELKRKKQKLPCNQYGTVSIEGVADKVGCTTKVLLKGSLAKQFQKDVEEIGVEARITSDSKLAEIAEQKARDASSASKQLHLKIKECESLQDEVKRLTTRIRQLELRQKEEELSLHELLKTGRRFTL